MRSILSLLSVLLVLTHPDTYGGATPPRSSGVEVTYLGTNGYLLRSPGCTLLVDPYFTRLPLFRAALDLTVRSEPRLVEWGLGKGRVPRRVDAILVTHGHIDHLLDVPSIARKTGARVIASKASTDLCRSMGVPMLQLEPVGWGSSARVGSARIQALAASHDRILGRLPFPGEITRRLPPQSPSDWICGEPLAFLIEVAGQRIYIDSGGTLRGPIPRVGPVDLAILGVALPDARARLPLALRRLQPRYFLPSHQDNFFRPLARGFSYGPLTDASHVERTAARMGHEQISMQYFQPWTLR